MVLDCIDFWALPSALLLYWEIIKRTFLSETTMPSTLIFGLQHHLVPSTNFIQFGAQGLLSGPTCELTRSLTIRIYWENLMSNITRHRAGIGICYVASPSIPLLSLFTLLPLYQNWSHVLHRLYMKHFK